MILVPENFAAFTVTRAGDAGRQWIESLPDLVEICCRRWSLVIDGPPMHGGLSLVVPMRQGDRRCVLKLGWIDEATAYEAFALTAWNGKGAVLLFESYPERGAMLLERLDNRHSLNDLNLQEAIPIAGQLLRRLAIPAPEGIPRLQGVAERFAETFLTDGTNRAVR